MFRTIRWSLQKILLNWFKQFLLNTRYSSQTAPLDTQSAVLTTGQRFYSNLQFFSIKIRMKSKKKKSFLLLQFAPLDYSTNWSNNASGTKTFFKERGSKWNEEVFFKKHACILLKRIFNTVAICSLVCWVPCNLFSLNLQLVRKIFHTETWFFNWSSPSAFMFSTGDCLQS